MSSSEIALVSGKEYNVSHDGLSWVKRVFLYTNAFGAYICQTHLGWSNGDLPTMCRAFAWIKEIPVEKPLMKKIIMVKKANEIMQHLLREGYKPDEKGYWHNGKAASFAPGMWFYCGKVWVAYEYTWLDEWLYAEWVPVEDGE